MRRIREILAALATGIIIVIWFWYQGQFIRLEAQLVKNTDQCLVNCELIFRVRFNKDWTLLNSHNFRFAYIRHGPALDLQDYGIQILEEAPYKISIPETVCHPWNETVINGTNVTVVTHPNCTTTYHEETRYRDEWKDLTFPYSFEKDKWYYVRFWGKKKPKLGPNNIEVLPYVLGKRLHFTWWNSSWTRRMNITINNTQNSYTLTDYQLAVNITYDSDMVSDFSDLRFTWYNSTADSETEIPYWVEKKVDSSWAYIWVKVIEIPASSYATVYVYYKNPSAASESNGTAVFEFFDDFSDGDFSGWNLEGSSTGDSASASNYYFELTKGGTDGSFWYSHTFSALTTLKLLFYWNVSSSTGAHGAATLLYDASGLRGPWTYQSPYDSNWYYYVQGVGYNVPFTGAQENVWYRHIYLINTTSDTFDWYVYNSTNLALVNSSTNLDFREATGDITEIRVHVYWANEISAWDNFAISKYSSPEPTYSIGSEESYGPPPDTCTPGANIWNMDCNDNCTKTGVIDVNGPWNIYGSNGYFLCNGCNLTVNETNFNATNCKLIFTGNFKYTTRG